MVKNLIIALLCLGVATATNARIKEKELPPSEWVLADVATPGVTPFKGLETSIYANFPDCEPEVEGEFMRLSGCFKDMPHVYLTRIESFDGKVQAIIHYYGLSKYSFGNNYNMVERTIQKKGTQAKFGEKGRKAKWKTAYGEIHQYEGRPGVIGRIGLFSNAYLERANRLKEAQETEVIIQQIIAGTYVPPVQVEGQEQEAAETIAR